MLRANIHRDGINLINTWPCSYVLYLLTHNDSFFYTQWYDVVSIFREHLCRHIGVPSFIRTCPYYHCLFTCHYPLFVCNTLTTASEDRSPSIAADMIPPA